MATATTPLCTEQAIAREHSRSYAARALGWLHSSQVTVPTSARSRALVDRLELGHSQQFAYPESTGYAVSVLEGIISLGEHTALDVALSDDGACFLSRSLIANAGGLPGSSRQESTRRRLYTFDTGIALKGLAGHCQRARPIEQDALALGMQFILRAIAPDGTIHPLLASPQGRYEARWSTRPGSYLLKALLGLACADLVLHGTLRHRQTLTLCLLTALRAQTTGGHFLGQSNIPLNMHAHLYACEAAYLLGNILNLAQAMEASRAGVTYSLGLFTDTNSLPPCLAPAALATERSDTVAQLLRLCLLASVGSRSEHLRLANRLALYQHDATGALRFGTDYEPALRDCRECRTHLSTHATLFAVQAWLALSDSRVVARWRDQPWTFA